jgi:hypothetical protein
MVQEKLDIHKQKNETWYLSLTLYKTQLKSESNTLIQDLKLLQKNRKVEAQGIRNHKNWQVELRRIKKHSIGNNYQRKDTALQHKSLCQLFIWMGINVQNTNWKIKHQRTNIPINKWLNKLNTSNEETLMTNINMFNIFSHQVNANQNYTEILSQNG